MSDAWPFVSVIIPTHGRSELLSERALPAVLAQTHARIEVLVIGDSAGPDTAAAVRRFEDPRVEYVELTQRYEYPDRHRHWLEPPGPGAHEPGHDPLLSLC